MSDITAKDLKARLDAGESLNMIDVREPHEWDMQHLPGVQKISLGLIPQKLAELEDLKDKEVILICRSGNRSGRATEFLKNNGFSNPRNLAGGMLNWRAEIDPDFQVQ
jgi:rhodanese-related sulfurtransferase